MKFYIYLIIVYIILSQMLACSGDKTQKYYRNKYSYHLVNKEYEQGFKVVNEMIQKYPDLAIWYHYKSRLFYEMGRYKEAEKQMLQAIQKYDVQKKKNSEYSLNVAYQYLSLIYDKQDKDQEALDVLEKAIIIDSTNAQSYRSLAIHYSNLGKYKQALLYIDKAMQYNEDRFKDLLDIKYDILLQDEDYTGLVEFINYLLENCSEDSCRTSLKQDKIIIDYKFGNFDEIIKSVSDMRKTNSNSLLNLYYRGLAYLGKAEYSKAKEDFELCKSLHDDDFIYNFQMMFLNILKKDHQKAKNYYKKINLKKEELYNSYDFSDISDYLPHKIALMEFIEAQPE